MEIRHVICFEMNTAEHALLRRAVVALEAIAQASGMGSALKEATAQINKSADELAAAVGEAGEAPK